MTRPIAVTAPTRRVRAMAVASLDRGPGARQPDAPPDGGLPATKQVCVPWHARPIHPEIAYPRLCKVSPCRTGMYSWHGSRAVLEHRFCRALEIEVPRPWPTTDGETGRAEAAPVALRQVRFGSAWRKRRSQGRSETFDTRVSPSTSAVPDASTGALPTCRHSQPAALRSAR